MVKGTLAHCSRSSSIHLVEEDDAPTVLDPDRASLRLHLLPKRTGQEKSGAAMHHLEAGGRAAASNESTAFDTLSAATVLREIFGLLEVYGPTWYTEEIHNRAVAALAPNMR